MLSEVGFGCGWILYWTVKVRFTTLAGAYWLLPAWLAQIVTLPGPSILIRLSEVTLATLMLLLRYLTGRPELATALGLNGALPDCLVEMEGNVMN